MNLLRLRKELRRIIFREEEMVDSRRNLDSQPFCKLLVLYTQVLDRLLVLDLLEEFGEAVTLDNVTAEPVKLDICRTSYTMTYCSM
jgi:hypothetical protein